MFWLEENLILSNDLITGTSNFDEKNVEEMFNWSEFHSETNPPTLSTNIMARMWNEVPGLQNATTLGAAKSLAKKWAKDIPR